ncbi:MAG: N-acetylmuramoyl-L-alanine amidase [Spirochaetes bacterium]|nr:N-acetylmuramoyl-L-alanine amidase [Spirochaetota bacterium]
MNYLRCTIIFLLVAMVSGCDKMNCRLKLLVGDISLNGFYSLESDSLTIYASPEDKEKGRIECRIYRDEYALAAKMFRVFDSRSIRDAYLSKGGGRFDQDIRTKLLSMDETPFRPGGDPVLPLAGLRVAIDPGHNAGSMSEAKRENKYMWLFAPDGKPITFYEARLNLATAMELKELLERDGAEVMLTREQGRQTYPIPFDRWVRRDFRRSVREKQHEGFITPEHAEKLLNDTNEKRRYKFFNSEYEMPNRANIINAFRPHLAVSVHYNSFGESAGFREKYGRLLRVMEKPHRSPAAFKAACEEVVDSTSETGRNFCLAFVPGCFLRGELDTVESRIEFLRLILTSDLEESIRFSSYVIGNFRKLLGVAPAGDRFPGARRAGICRKGVYSRNLRMTRLVRGPLCLGEPLLQNNMQEAVRLVEISNGKVPERVALVARAYYLAIRKYADR